MYDTTRRLKRFILLFLFRLSGFFFRKTNFNRKKTKPATVMVIFSKNLEQKRTLLKLLFVLSYFLCFKLTFFLFRETNYKLVFVFFFCFLFLTLFRKHGSVFLLPYEIFRCLNCVRFPSLSGRFWILSIEIIVGFCFET